MPASCRSSRGHRIIGVERGKLSFDIVMKLIKIKIKIKLKFDQMPLDHTQESSVSLTSFKKAVALAASLGLLLVILMYVSSS